MKSEKSVVEHEIKEVIQTLDNSVVLIKDIDGFKSLLGKIVNKIEELRISRDKKDEKMIIFRRENKLLREKVDELIKKNEMWKEKYNHSKKRSLI